MLGKILIKVVLIIIVAIISGCAIAFIGNKYIPIEYCKPVLAIYILGIIIGNIMDLIINLG